MALFEFAVLWFGLGTAVLAARFDSLFSEEVPLVLEHVSDAYPEVGALGRRPVLAVVGMVAFAKTILAWPFPLYRRLVRGTWMTKETEELEQKYQ